MTHTAAQHAAHVAAVELALSTVGPVVTLGSVDEIADEAWLDGGFFVRHPDHGCEWLSI
jgi:hypothetical protein